MGKIGRNDPCPCGSGKKYKYCCINGNFPSKIRHNNETLIEDANSSNAVIFIFDTNAHSYLIDHLDFSNIILKYKNYSPPYMPQFSSINFFEYLNGITNENVLINRQAYIRNIYKSTLGGTILLNADSHLKDNLGILNDKQKNDEAINLIKYIRYFLSLKTLKEFIDYFQPLQNEITESIQRFTRSISILMSNILELKKEFKRRNNIEEFNNIFSKLPSDKFYDMILPLLITKFKLPQNIIEEDIKIIFDKLPSLKYYADLFWKYIGHLCMNNGKPKENDHWDREQVIYLNIADYYVTRDKKLRSLINNCGNIDLEGRAISPEEFVSAKKAVFQKKAPRLAKRCKIIRQ